MKRIAIAVCDADKAYGESFISWISLEKREKFSGGCFSEVESFLQYLNLQRPDIVLLGKGFLKSPQILDWIVKGQEECLDEGERILCICLSSFNEKEEMSGMPEAVRNLPVLDKYQPASQLVREILSYYQAYGRNEAAPSVKRELVGLYSPGHSIWQTPFALTLAQVLGQQERVLYVNLKECAGFAGWFQKEYEKDLLDVMYLCLTGEGNVSDCVGSAAYQMANFSYIPPAEDSICLGEILKQDYLKFVKLLAEQSGYDVVILDFGMMVPGFFELFKECSKVYILTERGELPEAPLRHFRQMVDRQGLLALQERMEYLTLPQLEPMPYQGGQWLQQWMWGGLGDYVRSLMGVQSGTD